MKNIELSLNFLYLPLAFCILSMYSCKKESSGNPNNDPTTTSLKITSFAPLGGEVADSVTILGVGFSKTASSNKVAFNGTQATVITATDTSLRVTVPAGASTGKITVTSNNNTGSSDSNFIVGPVVFTLAGGPPLGYQDGTGTTARFSGVCGLAMDASGNLYVTDANNNRIRKVTPAGVVTTFAGDGSTSVMSGPWGVAIDASGNLYVSDMYNNRILKITQVGVITTLAGGTAGNKDGQGTDASFSWPKGLTVDASGNVFVADCNNHRIRKITPAGLVTTVAGTDISGGFVDGDVSVARFNFPSDVAIDASGNLYVTDEFNYRVRKITPAGVVSTFAGAWTYTILNDPLGITIDASGNLYVADISRQIKKISPTGVVTIIAGSGENGYVDGPASLARFNNPYDLAVDASGKVYVTDWSNGAIRVIR
ncbi:IPT/TIG domain-containing protein [Chitinophaga tropicalis]|nr:IPT/TIG domain-containing protein [Chitinophaga tropicalis]